MYTGNQYFTFFIYTGWRVKSGTYVIMYSTQIFAQSRFYLCRFRGTVYWRQRINILCNFAILLTLKVLCHSWCV